MTESPLSLRVMQSFRAPRPTTNPYITMLDGSLAGTPGIEHLRFSWTAALLGRYDVFHWHWPEGKLHGTTWWKSTGKYLLTAALSMRHRLSRRIVVVRTVHNIELPDDNAARLWLLRRIDAQTDHRIVLNSTTPVTPGQVSTRIPHGHYVDWYAKDARVQRIPGRIGSFGGIRRYKSVDALVDAFTAIVRDHPDLSLRIGGRPSTPQLADDLRQRSAGVPNIELSLDFLSDSDLVELATQSELIVLAYRFMHNSGSVLAALSLSRPVLVPRNEANEELAREVGSDWVLMYDDELKPDVLLGAWRQATQLPPGAAPDLAQRSWETTGRRHAEVYRAAVDQIRSRRRGRDDGQ